MGSTLTSENKEFVQQFDRNTATVMKQRVMFKLQSLVRVWIEDLILTYENGSFNKNKSLSKTNSRYNEITESVFLLHYATDRINPHTPFIQQCVNFPVFLHLNENHIFDI